MIEPLQVINVARDHETRHVYVGRKFAWKDATPWGNPFRGAGAVEKYREWIEQRPELIKRLSDELERTGTTALGCWCKRPDIEVPCHGDVLAELVVRYRQDILNQGDSHSHERHQGAASQAYNQAL